MMSKQLQVYAVISMNHQQLKAIQSSLNSHRDLAKLNMTRTKETSMKTSTPKNKSVGISDLLISHFTMFSIVEQWHDTVT